MAGESAAKGGVPRSWQSATSYPDGTPFLGGNGGVQEGLAQSSGNFDGPFMFGVKPAQGGAGAVALANAGAGQQEFFHSRPIKSREPVVLDEEVQDVKLPNVSAVDQELDRLLVKSQTETKQPVPIADILTTDEGNPVFVSNTGNANRRPIWEGGNPIDDARAGSGLVTDEVSAGIAMQPPVMKASETSGGSGNFSPEPGKFDRFKQAVADGARKFAAFMQRPVFDININGRKDVPVRRRAGSISSNTNKPETPSFEDTGFYPQNVAKNPDAKPYSAIADELSYTRMDELRARAAERAAEREKAAAQADETGGTFDVAETSEAAPVETAPVIERTPAVPLGTGKGIEVEVETPKVGAYHGGEVKVEIPEVSAYHGGEVKVEIPEYSAAKGGEAPVSVQTPKASTPPEPIEPKVESEDSPILERPIMGGGIEVEVETPKVSAYHGGEVKVEIPEGSAYHGGEVKVETPKVGAYHGGEVQMNFPAGFSSPKVGRVANVNPRRNNVGAGVGAGESEPVSVKEETRDKIDEKVETNIRDKLKTRGSKALGATEDIYLMATDGVSKEEAKKEAAAAAYRQLREYDIAKQKAKDEKMAEANQRALAAGKKQKGKLGMIATSLMPWNIAKNFVDRSKTVVERAVIARQSYKTALEAIEQTGKRSSGHIAAEMLAAQRAEKKATSAKSASEFLKRGIESAKKYGGMDVRDIRAEQKAKSFKNRKNEIISSVKNADMGGGLHDRIFDALSDDYAIKTYGLADPDRAMVDRAIQAHRAGEFNQDKGVEFKEQTKDNELSRAIKAFAVKVAGYDDTVDTNTEISKEDFKAEMSKRDAARKEIADVVQKHLGGTTNNANEVVRLIERNLKGALREELKDPQQHKEAVRAIEEYIDDHFHFDKFKVNDSGLAMSEKGYANFVDKMAIGNVGIAIAVGLGGAYASGLMRSTAIQQISNSQVVTAAAKVVIAAGLGATRGIVKTKREQMRDNIDAALGLEVKKTKGRTNFDSIMLDATKATEALKQGANDLIGEHGINKTARDGVIKQIGEILARNELQEKKRGKVNLFRYSGKDKVERGKADLYKAMNDVMEKLRASGMGADEIQKLIAASQAESMKGLEQSYNLIKKEQASERYKKGARDGAIAGSAAVFATFAMDLIRGKSALINEINEIRSGSKKFKMEGWHLNVVANNQNDAMAAVAGAGAVAEEAAARQQAGHAAGGKKNFERDNLANSKGKEFKSELEKNYEYPKEDLEKPVLFETADNGGQAIGIDRNRNGTIEASEYICGTSKANGLNLARENDFNNMRTELESRGFRVEVDDVTTNYPKGATLETYMSTKVSVRKDVKIDEWKQAYEMSNNITRVPGDGEGLFKGHVDALNGKEVPAGTKVLYDPDGDGPLGSVELAVDSKGDFYVPEELAAAVKGDSAKLAGVCRVVNEVDGKLVCGTTNKSGLILSANTEVSMSDKRIDRAFTIFGKNEAGKEVPRSQFAVDAETGEPTSNYSEIFDNRDGHSAAYFMQEEENAGVVHIQGSGEVKQRVRTNADYDEKHDSNLNDPFKGKTQYVSTPNTVDADGDGIISAAEAEAYYAQTMNKIGTDPQFMMEQADQYGVLKPENMERFGFTSNDYTRLGITDGQIDTEEEFSLVIQRLQEKGNGDLLQKFVNATNQVRGEKLDGCMIEEITIYDRVATYSKDGSLRTITASTGRKAVRYYRLDENGNKVYVEYEGTLLGKNYKGPVTDIEACGQIAKKNPPKTGTTPTKPPSTTEQPPERTTSKPPEKTTEQPPSTSTTASKPPEEPSTTASKPPEEPSTTAKPPEEPEPKKPMPTEQPGEGDGKLPPTTTLPPGSPTSAPGPTTERPKMPSR